MERAKERQLPQKVRVPTADIEDRVAGAQRLGHTVCFQEIPRRIGAILARRRAPGVREPRHDALHEIDGTEGETPRARRLLRSIPVRRYHATVGSRPRHVMYPLTIEPPDASALLGSRTALLPQVRHIPSRLHPP